MPARIREKAGREVVMKKDTQWKMLIATAEETEAEILKNRLESEGIRCRLEVRRVFPGTSHGGKTGGVEVYVPLEDFEASQQIVELGELDGEDGL